METKRCIYCASLTVQKLAELVEKETPNPDRDIFPHHSYEHQPSIGELECSADSGCDLCSLILELCKNFEIGAPGNPPPATVYTKAMSRESSQIRLAIRINWEVGDVMEPLDEMQVLVGARDDRLQVPTSERIQLPLLNLLVKTSRDSPCIINGLQIGRFHTNRDLGADENFALANFWLQACREGHRQCWANTSGWLPTRVIDVSVERPRLVLTCGEKGGYVALSHCWGGSVSMCLTTDTIDTFREGLPLEELAENFRDAITITRRLGIRYLWIDCLCIIQDSREDWVKESRKMGKVYNDATLTIYASGSESSSTGILRKPRFTRQQRTVAIQAFPGSASEITVTKLSFTDFHGNIDTDGPLNRRGWTLQELALCPRQLLYDREQLYWRCREEYLCAKGLLMNINPHEPKDISLTTLLDDAPGRTLGLEERMEAVGTFYRLVKMYSDRALTFDSDRLPALSGLCERLHKYMGGAYLAGIWECSLATGLVWKKGSRRGAPIHAPEIPSWSWASFNGSVEFFHDAITLGSGQLELIAHDIQLRDENNPYGEVTSGRLTVKGLLLPLIRSRQYVPLHGSYQTPTITFDDEDEPPQEIEKHRLVSMEGGPGHNSYMVSFPQTFEELPPVKMDTSLWSSEQYAALLVSRRLRGSGRSRGLVLRQLASEELTFERVGIFDGPDEFFDGQHETWFLDTITLV